MNDTQLTLIKPSHQVAIQPASSNHCAATSTTAQETEQPRTDIVEQNLTPADRGIAAWRLLSAALIFETLFWGFPLSFGVFQDHYFKTPEFAGPICVLGLALGSLVTSLEALSIQGVAYGFGFLIFYYPILSMVDEYWITKRGMAYGMLCCKWVLRNFHAFCASSSAGQRWIQDYFESCCGRADSAAGPLITLFKGRLPVSRSTASRKIDWTFLRMPSFWIHSVANILQGFGYFFPGLYLPSYASSLSLNPHTGAMLLAVMSTCQVCGQFSFGILSDKKVSINTVALLSTAAATISVLGIWKVASSLSDLIVFGILYGFSAAGFTAIRARITSSETSDVGTAPVVYGLLNPQKASGNVLTGPIGAALIGRNATTASGMFRWVILFTGVCMAESSCATLLQRLRFAR